MKFSAYLIAAAALTPLASQVAAQGSSGISHEGSTVSLAYNFHNLASDQPYSDYYTTMLSARSSYALGGGFGATFSIGYQSEVFDDSFFSERYILDINPTYSFGDADIGLFYTAISRGDGSDEGEAIYGVTATYQSGPFGFEAYSGKYDEGNGFEHMPFGIAASYDLIEGTSIYLAHQRDRFDGGFYEGATTIGASYDLAGLTGAPIRITAAASRHHGDSVSLSDSEWNQFTVAAAYDISGGSSSVFNSFRSWSFYFD